MNIIQLYEEKENQDCFEFLENKIREASQQMIERIYSEEVLDFLNRFLTAWKLLAFYHKNSPRSHLTETLTEALSLLGCMTICFRKIIQYR